MALQAKRDVYKEQLQKCQNIITHLKKSHIDNIVMIIEKNTTLEEDGFYDFPYYIARIQRRFIKTKKSNGLKHNIVIIDL